MKKRNLFCACLLIFVLLLLSGCGCQHEWEEATCRTAKTCIHCGKTSGEPLRHDWQEATCTAPKTCARCGRTKGEALDHIPGEEVETLDVINAKYHREKCCTVCGSFLEQEDTDLDSFLTDESTFLFSPNQFLERFSTIVKEYYPNFSYSVEEVISGTMVFLDWGIGEDYSTHLIFHHADTSAYTLSEYDDPGVFCIAFLAYGVLESIPMYLEDDMLFAIALAADPLFADDDLDLLLYAKYVSLVNPSEGDDTLGYWAKHEMLYQFGHDVFSKDGTDTGCESALIYATISLDFYE